MQYASLLDNVEAKSKSLRIPNTRMSVGGEMKAVRGGETSMFLFPMLIYLRTRSRQLKCKMLYKRGEISRAWTQREKETRDNACETKKK